MKTESRNPKSESVVVKPLSKCNCFHFRSAEAPKTTHQKKRKHKEKGEKEKKEKKKAKKKKKVSSEEEDVSPAEVKSFQCR